MSALINHVSELLGYCAAALVFITFSLKSLVALRTVAIASNLMFIAYALVSGLTPILLLHAALLPTNVFRLCQCLREQRAASEQNFFNEIGQISRHVFFINDGRRA